MFFLKRDNFTNFYLYYLVIFINFQETTDNEPSVCAEMQVDDLPLAAREDPVLVHTFDKYKLNFAQVAYIILTYSHTQIYDLIEKMLIYGK